MVRRPLAPRQVTTISPGLTPTMRFHRQPPTYALAGSNDFGVYAFPRFMLPGELYGQGWLYTANSSKVTFESTGQNSVTTTELVTEEVYPVGNVDPTLVDI